MRLNSSKEALRKERIFIEGGVTLSRTVEAGTLTQIWTGARIGENVTIGRGVHIGVHSVIEDDVILGDFSYIGDHAVIGRGVKLPNRSVIENKMVINKVLQYKGEKHVFTHLGGDKLMVGCLIHPIPYWLENYQEIGKKYGYNEKETEQAFELINKINDDRRSHAST